MQDWMDKTFPVWKFMFLKIVPPIRVQGDFSGSEIRLAASYICSTIYQTGIHLIKQ